MDGYTRHVKDAIASEYVEELQAVDDLARRLVSHIDDTREEIAAIHVHGAKSQSVQDHFARLLDQELGFPKRSFSRRKLVSSHRRGRTSSSVSVQAAE